MNFEEKSLQQVRESRFLINRVDDWLFTEITPYLGKRILEVGCGLGNMLPRLLDRDYVLGIDISKESTDEIDDHYREYSNIQAQCIDITKSESLTLKIYEFDTIISINVLEHIEDDVLALQNLRSLLLQGYLITIVPAHQTLFGKMDQTIGHFRRYNKKSFKQELESVGFSVVNQKYINTLGALGWLINGRLLNSSVPPTDQLIVFNRLVPILRFCEGLFNMPFGISLVSIAK